MFKRLLYSKCFESCEIIFGAIGWQGNVVRCCPFDGKWMGQWGGQGEVFREVSCFPGDCFQIFFLTSDSLHLSGLTKPGHSSYSNKKICTSK
jgi:hypothetical protein